VDIADELRIREVVAAYGFAVDDRDWDALARVFTADAVVDFAGAGYAPIRGAAAIRHSYAHVMNHPEAHILTNLVLVPGANGAVTVRCKALYPRAGGVCGHGEYRLTVVRGQDGWRIARMVGRSGRPPSSW